MIDGATALVEVPLSADGSYALLADGAWSEGADRSIDGTPTLRCKVQLEGRARYNFGGDMPCDLFGRSMVFLYSPPGCYKHEVIQPGTVERSITLIYPVQPDAIADLGRDDPAVNRALASISDRLTLHTVAMPRQILSIAATILDTEDAGRHAARLRRVRSEELSLLSLDIFLDSFRTGVPAALTRRERRQVEEVRHILEEHLAAPPGLAALARHVGCNRTKLNENFRAVLGMSVFQYLQQERMHLARRMIDRTAATITDVAERCGYEHVSNFSIAFKSYFGVPPSALRRH